METGSDLAPAAETEASAEGTVVDVAIAAGSFSTLVQALEAANLVETLQGEGPFTVFAPTDEAFESLPEGTLENLLLPENQDQLVQVLTYHVVPGAVESGDLVDGDVATVEGGAIAVTTGEQVTVNDAEVLQPDISASNGVIHVIDAVLLPAS
ncbi:MAG: fasciclin domain-containing protein [Cyanobacteria bacterium J06639_1]